MKVITIGSNPKCDVVMNTDGIEPIHCQIIQDNGNNYRIVAFGNGVRLNHKIVNGEISLKENDKISVGTFDYRLDWENWLYGAGLDCKKCNYMIESLLDDPWCTHCLNHNYAPPPTKWGYSWYYSRGQKCEVCGTRGDNNVDKFCYYCMKHDQCFWMPEDYPPDTHMKVLNKNIQNYELATGDTNHRFHNKTTNDLLVSVVNKMLLGITEWSLEELQYQKNNPQEIEKALYEISEATQSAK
jgi:hypothetical protein